MKLASEKAVASGGWLHAADAAPVAIRPRKEEPPINEQQWSDIAAACFENAKATEARATMAMQLGVSVEALERLQVGCGFDRYRGLWFTTWPERRGRNKVTGIIRRYGVPVTEQGGNKLTMKGSKHGLYLPVEWWQGKGPLCIVEGGSDTAAILTLGLAVIGRPSNTGGVNMLLGAMSDWTRPVYVIGERDEKPEKRGTVKQCPGDCAGCAWCWPGLFGAMTFADALRKARRDLARKVFVKLPPDGAKDSRAWVNSYAAASGAKFLARVKSV